MTARKKPAKKAEKNTVGKTVAKNGAKNGGKPILGTHPGRRGGTLQNGNPGNKGGTGRPKEAFKNRLGKALHRGKVTKYFRECLDGEHGPAAHLAALNLGLDRVHGKVPSVSEVRGSDEPLVIILKKGY